MKKVMIAAAAAIASSAFCIESANTVGYNTTDFTGRTMVCVGVPFTAVGDATTFKLGDFTAEGFDSGSDLLQTIDPDSADGVDLYVYLDADTYGALAGWWDADVSERMDDVEFDVGTGFLGAFGAQEVLLRGSGEVPTSPVTLDYTGKTMVIVPNPLPRTVTLSEVTAEGFDSGSDLLQTIDPDSADGVDLYVYLDADTYGALAGWWDADVSERMDDVEIPAGEAMLGAFGSGEVVLTFPAAL